MGASKRLQLHRQGIDALNEYIEAQHGSGLVDHKPLVPFFREKILYETHWGIHRRIIAPEVRRIAAPYKLHLKIWCSKQNMESQNVTDADFVAEDSKYVLITLYADDSLEVCLAEAAML